MRGKIKSKLVVFLLLIFTFVGICIFLKDLNERRRKVEESYCLTDNIITVREGGRLGNCVWEYISALGIGNLLGLRPYVPKKIFGCLSKVFKNLTIPAYEDTLLSEQCRKFHGGDFEKCESESLSQNGTAWDRLCYALKHGKRISYVQFKPVTELKKLKSSLKLPPILILPQWMNPPYVFDAVGVDRFKQELQIREDVKQLAEDTLRGVKMKAGNGDVIFIGVHVRRTDYDAHLRDMFGNKVAYADVDYYKRAMSRMHDLYNDSRMVFVVLSDDYTWCKTNLLNETEGVYWGGLEQSAFIPNWEQKKDMFVSHDLAVLVMQNHSIIGYGTFAVTGSILNGGHTIVCNISRYQDVKDNFAIDLSKKIPDWEQL